MFNLGIRKEVVANAPGRRATRASDIVLKNAVSRASGLSVFEDLSRSCIAESIDDGTLSATREMRETDRFQCNPILECLVTCVKHLKLIFADPPANSKYKLCFG